MDLNYRYPSYYDNGNSVPGLGSGYFINASAALSQEWKAPDDRTHPVFLNGMMLRCTAKPRVMAEYKAKETGMPEWEKILFGVAEGIAITVLAAGALTVAAGFLAGGAAAGAAASGEAALAAGGAVAAASEAVVTPTVTVTAESLANAIAAWRIANPEAVAEAEAIMGQTAMDEDTVATSSTFATTAEVLGVSRRAINAGVVTGTSNIRPWNIMEMIMSTVGHPLPSVRRRNLLNSTVAALSLYDRSWIVGESGANGLSVAQSQDYVAHPMPMSAMMLPGHIINYDMKHMPGNSDEGKQVYGTCHELSNDKCLGDGNCAHVQFIPLGGDCYGNDIQGGTQEDVTFHECTHSAVKVWQTKGISFKIKNISGRVATKLDPNWNIQVPIGTCILKSVSKCNKCTHPNYQKNCLSPYNSPTQPWMFFAMSISLAFTRTKFKVKGHPDEKIGTTYGSLALVQSSCQGHMVCNTIEENLNELYDGGSSSAKIITNPGNNTQDRLQKEFEGASGATKQADTTCKKITNICKRGSGAVADYSGGVCKPAELIALGTSCDDYCHNHYGAYRSVGYCPVESDSARCVCQTRPTCEEQIQHVRSKNPSYTLELAENVTAHKYAQQCSSCSYKKYTLYTSFISGNSTSLAVYNMA
ncbi:MAG: hypothetical protein CML73_00445 [Rhodobiaceae bacterium]|nr:hypothetical protein [Rhodobiaceae bacterium]